MREEEIFSIKRRFGIIGNSEKLNRAIEVAVQVAPTDMSVLILGESGVGKESFSKIIHQLSKRKHGQFIAINCGAIPEGTIDSELFGHEKGSFTGAHEARKGYFEVTNGGTIFLDEIGEMPMGTQARLLRVLENGEFIKVGSSKILKTDVRVVAASNLDLTKSVEEGRFREDLFYRLSTVPIRVPALRERKNDIELLFRKFAIDFAEKYKTKPIQLDDEAKQMLLQYRFPGNIRQLKNLVEQISVIEINRKIPAETLLKYLPKIESTLPALYRDQAGEGKHFSERELLYKVLFDMKKDMNELKKLVYHILQEGQEGKEEKEIIKEHPELFEEINNGDDKSTDVSNKPLVIERHSETPSIKIAAKPDEEETTDIEDITHEEDESLSIEKKEIELIKKALRKNHNKRKYAAKDLGISERTLYRKIKQYELEDL